MVLVPVAFVAGAVFAVAGTQLMMRHSRARQERLYATRFSGEHDLAGLELEAERWALKPLTGDQASDDLDDAVRRSVQSAIDETRRRLHPPPAVMIRVKP